MILGRTKVWRRCRISVFLAACLASGVATAGPPAGMASLEDIHNGTADEVLEAAFEDRQLIQLGEDMHITREMPEARMKLLPILHQEFGHRLILFEGATVDAWIAADLLLDVSEKGEDLAERARDKALPVMWHTPQYTELFEYIIDSFDGDAPLYPASYDFQPGFSRLGAEAIPTLFERLERHAAPPARHGDERELLTLFSDRESGFPEQPLPQEEHLQAAIDWLETWIEEAGEAIEKSEAPALHADTLRMIPGQLRAQTEIWRATVQADDEPPMLALQKTRDRLAAPVIERFRERAPGERALVWAHHVHVYHNTLGKTPHALGTDLRQMLDDGLYTLGIFAGKGEIYAMEMDGVSEMAFDATGEGLEGILDGLSETDFFLDFGQLEANALRESLQSETHTARGLPVIPDNDFHGAIYLHEVSRPEIRPFWETAAAKGEK